MQRFLFDDAQSYFDGFLPDQSRMPLNIKGKGRSVYSVVMKDLCEPTDALVVTGYSGLDKLVQLITARGKASSPLRLMLGNEPFVTSANRFKLERYEFSAEVRSYWLERGISLTLGSQILRCIELIRAGHVCIRYPRSSTPLHAKMYCSAAGATLGSSNFTQPGLQAQQEANVRFTPSEKIRFRDAWQTGEFFWSQGESAEDSFISLLEQLLKFVTWQEALARACAELLESEWASEYLKSLTETCSVTLWPAQRQGIGQALYLLDTRGGVLIADATGSGKTRLGAHLLRALRDRNWSVVRARKGSTLMVCPPLVAKNWSRETALCGLDIGVVSQGLLSRLNPDDDSTLAIQLGSAQILAVDEAHNFLNHASKRTRQLKNNLADLVVLFTATPINRSRADLLRLIDILGADNFDDPLIETFERLNKGGQDDEDVEALRAAIGSFTVRRTKLHFNAMVARNPDAYQSPGGRVCRYPQQQSATYVLSEPDGDRACANEIRADAGQLLGVSYFQKPLVLPDSWERRGITPELYLDFRLRAASSLAVYHVMSALRSSRLALYRHLVGEDAAWHRVSLPGKVQKDGDKSIGNMMARLGKFAGCIPENFLGVELPAWLCDPEAHRLACAREQDIYERIGACLDRMSGHREWQKVQHLLRLLEGHDQVLAFDHYPLTLRYLAHSLERATEGEMPFEVMLGVGGKRRIHELIQAKLDPAAGNSGKRIVLCSDALSEGVNLQGASTLTHLDMPSVVRVGEQRVGRIDRMNSPHDRIESWWPGDAPEFALRSDEVFVFRIDEVENLIGGNLDLPKELRAAQETRIITPEEQQQRMQDRQEHGWDGIEDAFAPVRGLVLGERSLIEPELYDQYRTETAKVLSRVSIVDAGEPWVFLCLAGEGARAPRWVFLSQTADQPLTDLREISLQLRGRLSAVVQTLEPTKSAMVELQHFLSRLSGMEQLLLPRLKQRALAQFKWALALWAGDRSWIKSSEQAEQISRLQRVLHNMDEDLTPDWGQLADLWLDLIRPRWAEYLERKGRKVVLKRLRDLESSLRLSPIEAEQLLKKFEGIELRRRWEERIVACILGCGTSR